MNREIYGLRISGTSEIKYVGQTRNGAAHRLIIHMRESRNEAKTSPLYVWLRANPGNVEAVVLESVPAEDESLVNEREVHWINFYREAGSGLLNVLPGGYFPKSTNAPSGEDHYNFGRKHSDETRKRLSKSRKLRVTTSETRNKMAQSSLGSRNPNGKLCEDDIIVIRAESRSGKSGSAIAKQFNVTPANISSILRGKTWAHVKEDNE